MSKEMTDEESLKAIFNYYKPIYLNINFAIYEHFIENLKYVSHTEKARKALENSQNRSTKLAEQIARQSGAKLEGSFKPGQAI